MRVWMGMAISFGAGYKAVVDWGVRLGVGKLDDLHFWSKKRASNWIGAEQLFRRSMYTFPSNAQALNHVGSEWSGHM